MDMKNLSKWYALLGKINLRLTAKPQALKKVKFNDHVDGAFYTLAFDNNLPVVVHANITGDFKHSEIKSLLRRAYNQGIATSPCIISYGNDNDLGILVCTDQEEEAFQFINLASPDAYSDTINDILLAANKTTTAEKITTVFKALDFEALSRRFFESASLCKDQFEADIFASTRMAKNPENEQNVSHYAIVVMARMIFLHFLEQKNLLNHDPKFIRTHVLGDDDLGSEATPALWNDFFKPLFEILNLPGNKRRGQKLNAFEFPYLNGGLFAAYDPIEGLSSFERLKIADKSIRAFYETCLYKYRMTTSEDTTQGGQKGVLDPELLGTIFERFMKDDVSSSTGSVYTPKDVVLYSVRNSLTRYFNGLGLPEKTAFDLVHQKTITKAFADQADTALSKLTLTDPCCGSGAFLLTSLHELFEIKRAIRMGQGLERWHNGDQRRAYETILRENIYGMDINPEAIILCHLRLWLPIIDLIDGSAGYDKIRPLPNLGLNIRKGNSLTNEKGDWNSPSWQSDEIKHLAAIRNEFFNCENHVAARLLAKFDEIANQDDSYVRFSRNFLDITMSKNGGFGVIVGNPPYLGLKDVKKIDYLKNWEEISGGEISDMYIMFTKESLKGLMPGGVLSYVTSNTYFTDSGKESFRSLLLGESKEFPTAKLTITDLSQKTFKGVGVNAAIFTLNKRRDDQKANPLVQVVHARTESKAINAHISELNDDPATYARRDGADLHHIFSDIPASTIKSIPGSNIFIPNRERLEFLNKFGDDWKRVCDAVWPLIETPKHAEKNSNKIYELRNALRPNDLTIIGLITEGGQGLATACNAVHLSLLAGSAEAHRVSMKIKKIELDIVAGNKAGKKAIQDKADIKETVKNIRKNGHPYAEAEYKFIYKTINPDQILDVTKLTASDLTHISANGISRKMAREFGVKYPTYVPYYKGQDSDFNRWYSRVDYYIDWSDDNVKWIKNNAGKSSKGSPNFFGPRFYFQPGFCWNDISSDSLQSRIYSIPGVNDVSNMKLNSTSSMVSNSFLAGFLNSRMCSEIIQLVTNTLHTQINDVKCLPIIIPEAIRARRVDKLVDAMIQIIIDESKSIPAKKTELGKMENLLDHEMSAIFNIRKSAA